MASVLPFFILLVFVVSGCLLTSFIFWYRSKRFVDKAQRAIGVVIKLRKVPFENRDTFAPVVRFETSDGRALSFTDPIAKYPAEFEVGDRTRVLYDPQDPHKARIVKRLSDLFLLARVFGSAGAVVLALGLVLGMFFRLRNF